MLLFTENAKMTFRLVRNASASSSSLCGCVAHVPSRCDASTLSWFQLLIMKKREPVRPRNHSKLSGHLFYSMSVMRDGNRSKGNDFPLFLN